MHCNSKALHLYFKRWPIKYHVGVRPVRLSDGEGGGLFFSKFSPRIWTNWTNGLENDWGGRVSPSPPRGGASANEVFYVDGYYVSLPL